MGKEISLLFDLGQVILTNDSEGLYTKEFLEYFDISASDVHRGWDSIWPQFQDGLVSEWEFWKKLLENSGSKRQNITKAKRIWRENIRPIEDMFTLLERLKPNYSLGALSNISKEFLDYKRKKFKLDRYFREIVSSGYTGIPKPDPRIYMLAADRMGVTPEDCLFIDDVESVLIPARDLGMKTILFRDQKALEHDLRSLGIRF